MHSKKLGNMNSLSDSVHSENVDGVLRGVLKVRVECSLDQFEYVALSIKSREGNEGGVKLCPGFNETQLPSGSSSIFTIHFQPF